MSWKEPTLPQMSPNEHEFKKKIVPVMHISVRHCTFYNFSRGVINVENNDKKPYFVAHFQNIFRPRPLTAFDLRLNCFAPNERSYRVTYFLKTAVLVLILEKLL